MRISAQLLRSRTSQPLHLVEYLDLSNLGLVSLERLELCPKLQTAVLRGNRIEAAPDLRYCPQLWKVDLANNTVRSLEGLFYVAAFGTLILSNNDLDWNELQKIRHVHILDLTLHGNQKLEVDAYYRMHVIDSLPLVWMLDGRIITSAERAQVEQFFKDSALSDRPVRHKLPKNQFVPSALKNISLTGVFGQKREHLMRRFPVKEKINVDLDKRRLLYLAYCLQQEVNLYVKNTVKGKVKPSQLIENLINYRNEDKERCNMLLLMLVASLEFAIPLLLVQQTLNIARLRKIRNVDTMDLFMLPRDIRCRVLSLLLGAVKIERDQHIDGGLYNRLYLCLYDLVADLVRLANGDSISKYQATRKKLDSRKAGYRCLLASEVVQLLCIVPIFFDFIGKDPGVTDLIITATKDSSIAEKIKALSWKIQSEGGAINKVKQETAEYLLECVKAADHPGSGKRSKEDDEVLKSEPPNDGIQPSYVITSKRLVKVSSQERPQSCVGSVWSKLQRCETAGAAKHRTARAASALGVRTRHSVDRRRIRPKSVGRKPGLGDRIEVGHQAFGRLAAIPEPNMGLVQLDTVAAPKFQQADYPISQLDQQFAYVDFADIKWDPFSESWTQIPYAKELKEIQRQRASRSASLDSRNSKGVSQFLSEAIRQNLQLRVDIPEAFNDTVSAHDGESFTQGNTVITDHVRSIVRECLQEADVPWASSTETDVNNNLNYKEEDYWDEREKPISPVDISVVTANIDSESAKDCCLVEDEIESNSKDMDEQGPEQDITLDEDAQDELESAESYLLSQGSPDMEEMVSYTENARINAWRTPEVIKKAANSGVPSRVGSATTRANANAPSSPPPQRPSSPTQPSKIPFKQADRWLAGGRDINSASVKHVSVPLPGWMQGLNVVRRPKSSPVVRGPRQTSSPVSSRTLLTRPNTGRLVRGAAWVQVRGSSPVYGQIQPPRVVVRRR
ncbi:uncharacterized protein [Porites lutea]|uniref:uncharacterized protein n=1 Tax=Porites lutea TaxID=51062 RepID=UPI003CC693CE